MRNIKTEKKNNDKLSFEYVKLKVENDGYVLVSKEYKNARRKLEYICPKGHKHFISWDKWKQGKRCFLLSDGRVYNKGNKRKNRCITCYYRKNLKQNKRKVYGF